MPSCNVCTLDDVITWKHFPRYWPFVRWIHQWPVNSLHKGPGRGTLMFPLIYAWINGWVNNPKAGDLRRHRAPYDVIVMTFNQFFQFSGWPAQTFCLNAFRNGDIHCCDVIVGAKASQITSLTIVCSTVYSGEDQRKHQSSASLAFAVNSPATGELPAQRANNAENVSITRRHHVFGVHIATKSTGWLV